MEKVYSLNLNLNFETHTDQKKIIIIETNTLYRKPNNSCINSSRVAGGGGGGGGVVIPQVVEHKDSSPTAAMANLTDKHCV